MDPTIVDHEKGEAATPRDPHVPGTDRGGEARSLPVAKLRPAYIQVSEQLRDLILTGVLRAGERLPNEADLGAQFGTSRSTVREALRMLASDGLLRTERGVNGGTFVTPPTTAGVGDTLEASLGILLRAEALTTHDLVEVRELLEGFAAGRVADAATDEERALLADLARKSRSANLDDNTTQQELSLAFHLQIAELSQNGLVRLLIKPTYMVLRTRHHPGGQTGNFWEFVADEHEEIARLIEARDRDGASDAMRRHLRNVAPFYTGSTRDARAAG